MYELTLTCCLKVVYVCCSLIKLIRKILEDSLFLFLSLFSCSNSRKLVCSQLELLPDLVPKYTTASLKNTCERYNVIHKHTHTHGPDICLFKYKCLGLSQSKGVFNLVLVCLFLKSVPF